MNVLIDRVWWLIVKGNWWIWCVTWLIVWLIVGLLGRVVWVDDWLFDWLLGCVVRVWNCLIVWLMINRIMAVFTFLLAHSPRPFVAADCPGVVCSSPAALLPAARCHVGKTPSPSLDLCPRLHQHKAIWVKVRVRVKVRDRVKVRVRVRVGVTNARVNCCQG